ncbi:hypothetical protein MROS_0277 [Melioribacter roseus P3M-2]|uniref:Uncharacterized protein n=1 Tax=Melioribacter roseus (strain DSM 23840 / JCM 17771 / VKM B-2668 / P3M-2) TaxID=1191523 RepID=I7A0N4_MELRP|nr:hypothetical protein [Melioribacter roseus]AFN73521.1 hypothetical protein MROS_0277 [Melioribacter roseus P3M-2]
MIKSIKNILILYLALNLAVFAVFLAGIINTGLFISVMTPSGIVLVNFIIFSILYRKSDGKSNKNFLLYNLGGMGLRMVLVLLLIFLSLKFLKIDKYGFIFAFFIWYILFLIVEIKAVKAKADAIKGK